MGRIVSLYLPTWPTDRLRRQMGDAAPPPERPLVIAGRDGRRRAIVADRAAQTLGVRPGLALAHAQARVPDLRIEPADPTADAAALARLALWALRRYGPVVAIDLPCPTGF
jgi:protein ImuB